MKNFHKALGLILLFLPGVFVGVIGDGNTEVVYLFLFFILFIFSVVYNLWLFKKYNISLPKNIKDTHRW